jgi:hypothetical protein
VAVVHIVHHHYVVAVRSGPGPFCALVFAACVRRGCPARRRRARGVLRGEGLRFGPTSPSKSPSYALRESLRWRVLWCTLDGTIFFSGGLALQGPAETSPRPADTSSVASGRCLAFSRRHRVAGGSFPAPRQARLCVDAIAEGVEQRVRGVSSSSQVPKRVFTFAKTKVLPRFLTPEPQRAPPTDGIHA